MAEPTEPQLSKREKRSQQDRETTLRRAETLSKKARVRRRLLIAGLVTGGAVMLGEVPLVRANSSTSPGFATSGNEIASRLKDLDVEIARNPNVLFETALEITEMAAHNFHQETGRPPIDVKQTVQFATDQKEISEIRQRLNQCKTGADNPDTLAETNSSLSQIGMYLPRTLENEIKSSSNQAAAVTFENAMHELSHILKSKIYDPRLDTIIIADQSLADFMIQGLKLIKPTPDNCYTKVTTFDPLDEGTIQIEIERLMRKLPGYGSYKVRGYPDLTRDLKQVITPHFQDSHTLFSNQGECDLYGYLEEVGRRVRTSQHTSSSNGVIGLVTLRPTLDKHTFKP